MDGFYVINEIRRRNILTPVLFLSGNQEEGSKILGISLGADDYLTKPFSLAMLTTKAQALLRFFMENQNQVFTKDQLYEQVWKQDIVDNNTIMVYIKRLRDKIETDPGNPVYLKTVWGVGYRFG